MARLDGKVALISGGARGQGAAEAILFAREGAKVVIGDLLDDEGRQVEAQIAELGGDATYIHLDVTSADDWDAAVQTALDRYGRLDILVNNAGIGGTGGGLENATLESWDRTLDINAKGVFLGTKAAIPAIRNAGGGSIVNISSIAGIIGLGDRQPRLRREQGCRPPPHQVHRHPARPRQHPLQLRSPRHDSDRHDRGDTCRPRTPEVLGRQHPARQARNRGRHRQRRTIPSLRRLILRNRQRASHRRRHSRTVAELSPLPLGEG